MNKKKKNQIYTLLLPRVRVLREARCFVIERAFKRLTWYSIKALYFSGCFWRSHWQWQTDKQVHFASFEFKICIAKKSNFSASFFFWKKFITRTIFAYIYMSIKLYNMTICSSDFYYALTTLLQKHFYVQA